jgi:hypothetical protein
MSGPIVRKYGFPNFDKIFGPQEPGHGVSDEKAPESSGEEKKTSAADARKEEGEPKGAKKS